MPGTGFPGFGGFGGFSGFGGMGGMGGAMNLEDILNALNDNMRRQQQPQMFAVKSAQMKIGMPARAEAGCLELVWNQVSALLQIERTAAAAPVDRTRL